jgi:hypothetical protein
VIFEVFQRFIYSTSISVVRDIKSVHKHSMQNVYTFTLVNDSGSQDANCCPICRLGEAADDRVRSWSMQVCDEPKKEITVER